MCLDFEKICSITLTVKYLRQNPHLSKWPMAREGVGVF